ncbi:MAG: cupin domain-containing protein [Pseudomonadota bacterium]|nr:cupin domain-containing protein [Pseudomonadota bacterium]
MESRNLSRFPIHLDLRGGAIPQPDFEGECWYEGYAQRTSGDGPSGRLVSLFTFTQAWETWEMHPVGDEVVLCIEGEMTLHQEHADGSKQALVLHAGDYAINPPGCWHTADASLPVTALFITCGQGTTHRPRGEPSIGRHAISGS